MSAGPATWPDLAAQLDQAARGDGSALATAGRLLTAAFSSQDAAPGLPAVGLTCADSPARQGPGAWRDVLDRLTGVSSIYGPVITWWRWAPCASWPARSADRYTGPWNASTKNPILVIGTRFDPNTPYVNARRTARRLGNAVLLTHDGYSHTSPRDPSACVRTPPASIWSISSPTAGDDMPLLSRNDRLRGSESGFFPNGPAISGPTAAARRTRRGGGTRTTPAPAASPRASPRRRTGRRRASATTCSRGCR